jgi:hypothetical protein
MLYSEELYLKTDWLICTSCSERAEHYSYSSGMDRQIVLLQQVKEASLDKFLQIHTAAAIEHYGCRMALEC